MFCFSCSGLFAQNGFFLQPEIAGGVGNAHFTSAEPLPASEGISHNIFSFEGTLGIGYRSKKWEFITGLGYFRTGFTTSWPGMDFQLANGPGLIGSTPEYISGVSRVQNPHFILPLKVGYQLFHLNKKLTFTPYLGAEFAYNLPRTFVQYWHETESTQTFNTNCYQYGVFGLAELSLEYEASNRIELTGGLSYHYDFSPLIHGQQEYDYAILVNLGIRYNFRHITAKNSTL